MSADPLLGDIHDLYRVQDKMGRNTRKPVFGGGGGFANNTGAYQPAHPRSLISAYVIRFLESIICKFATGKISLF